MPDKKGYATVLDNKSTLLDMTFLDTLGEDLPKDPLENSMVGPKYLDTEVQAMLDDATEKIKTNIKK